MAPSAVHLLMALLKAVAAVVPSALLLLLAVAVQQRAMAFHGRHFSFWGAAILNVRGTGNACEGPRGEWGLGHERFVRPMAEVLGPNGHGQRHTHRGTFICFISAVESNFPARGDGGAPLNALAELLPLAKGDNPPTGS